MDKLCAYEIDFIGLKTDRQELHYVADDAFFQALEGAEIQQGHVDMDVDIRYTAGTFELNVHLEGWVTVTCDRCLMPLRQPIEADALLRVKLGLEYLDDGDLITIPEEDGKLNIAWNLYEQIALQIPIRHVHPEGECVGDLGEAFAEAEQETDDSDKATDPRWDALKSLLDNNNN